MQYTNIFKEGKIGTLSVKNRIVASPVGDNMANPDGSISSQTIAYYTEKAKGGVGIVMPGAIPVEYPAGKSHANAFRIDQLKYTIGMVNLCRNVHAYGAMVIPQIQHAGARTEKNIIDGNMPRCVSDVDPEALSIRNCRKIGPQKELTIKEIKNLIKKYVKTAKYCQMAECDGVEVHMAHSYLLNQFLSPDTNKRTDEYGGSLENRMRFPLEVIRAIRKDCGSRFVIGARIPGAEFVKNGLSPEECRVIAVNLEKAGCDVLNVSVGMTVDQTKIREPQGAPQGARLHRIPNIKNAVSIPIMAAGTFKEPDYCEKILAENQTDFILMARQLICDPYWTKKVKEDRCNEIRPCISCNVGCFDSLSNGHPISCVLNPKAGFEFENKETKKNSNPKNIVIIGGGLAGMQAGITAAENGHNVRLYEKESKLGGQMNIASVPPGKDVIRDAEDWFIEETTRAGVKIYLNTEISNIDAEELKSDHIYYAVGAKPWAPNLPGIERGIQSWDILYGIVDLPKNAKVTIIGGGMVGCETALLLQQQGNKVTIVEMLGQIANGLEIANKENLINELEEGNAEFYTNTTVKAIEEGNVICQKDREEIRIESEIVVLAIGQKSTDTEFAKELKRKYYDVISIGDAYKPATFGEATKAGYLAASIL